MWIERGALHPQVVIDARLRIRAPASHATATSTFPFTPNQCNQLPPPIDRDLITLPAVDNEHAMKKPLNAEQIAVALPIIVEQYRSTHRPGRCTGDAPAHGHHRTQPPVAARQR